jgi:hypothetical protein
MMTVEIEHKLTESNAPAAEQRERQTHQKQHKHTSKSEHHGRCPQWRSSASPNPGR